MNHHSIVLLLAVAACSKRPDPPPPAPAAKVAPATRPAATPEAPPAEPADPNDAYFATDRSQVWRVHAGKITAVKMPERCSSLHAIVIPRDNVPWLDCQYQGYFLIVGDRALPAPVPEHNHGLIRGADGSLWTSSFKPNALYRLEGHEWKNVSIPEELRDVEQPQFAIDNKGRVYAVSNTAGYIRGADGTWAPFTMPADKMRRYPPHLFADEGGPVFMMIGYKWTEITDGKVGHRKYDNYQNPVPREGGGLVLGHEARVSIVDAGGKTERSVSFAKGAYGRRNGINAQSVAVDGRGRIWVATDYGLVIIDEKGAVEQWEPGRVPGFSASNVTVVAVGGKGPELPALGPKIRGEVVGRVADAAGKTLEMCTGSTGFSTGLGSSFYGSTPCAYNPIRFRAKLDGEGRFHFVGVPPYPMSAVVQLSSRDWNRRRAGCCSQLKPGAPLEIDL